MKALNLKIVGTLAIIFIGSGFFACGSNGNKNANNPAPINTTPVVASTTTARWGSYLTVVDRSESGFQAFAANFLAVCGINTGSIWDGIYFGAAECDQWTSNNNWFSIQSTSGGQVQVTFGNDDYNYTSTPITMTYALTNGSTQFRLAADDISNSGQTTQGFGRLEIIGDGSLSGATLTNVDVYYKGNRIATSRSLPQY
jgi:hypothetical protein